MYSRLERTCGQRALLVCTVRFEREINHLVQPTGTNVWQRALLVHTVRKRESGATSRLAFADLMQECFNAELPLLSKTGVGVGLHAKLVNLAPHLSRSLRKAWVTKMQKIKHKTSENFEIKIP